MSGENIITVSAIPIIEENNTNNGNNNNNNIEQVESVINATIVTEVVATENIQDEIMFHNSPTTSRNARHDLSFNSNLQANPVQLNLNDNDNNNVPPLFPQPTAPPAFTTTLPQVPISPMHHQVHEQQLQQQTATVPSLPVPRQQVPLPQNYDSPQHVSRVKKILTCEKEFWGAPLYSDTVTVQKIFKFLVRKQLCPDDEKVCLSICKHLIRNDFLHVYGSYNIDEVNILTMSTYLKIGRRYIISMEDFELIDDDDINNNNNNHNNNTMENKDLKQLLQRKSLTPEDALKIKEMMINETQQGNSKNNNNDSNGNMDQQQKRKSSDGTKKKRNSNPKKTISNIPNLGENIVSATMLKQDSSLNFFDRIARASRRILVAAPTNEQLAEIIKTSLASSIFQKYPQLSIDELQLHDIFAIDRTMRQRARPLDEGIVAKKNKVMNKEIYDPGLRSSYAPSAFRALRQLFNISEDFYANSLMEHGLEVINNGGGASGALFLRSKDQHFIIKGVTKSETQILRSILPHYIEHCQKYPDTTLPRIYSLLKVQVGVRPQDIQRVMVCNNVFDTLLNVDTSFDVKGSTSNRYIKLEDRIEYEKKHGKNKLPTLKDLNLIHPLAIPAMVRDKLMMQIRIDVEFLHSIKIMDYSLLVGCSTGKLAGGIIPDPEVYHSKAFQTCYGGILSSTSRATYFIGIIDIFQQYTAGKKVERFLKTKLLRRAGSSTTGDSTTTGNGSFGKIRRRQEKHACVDCHRQNTIYFPENDTETHIFEFICTFCKRRQECESNLAKESDKNISATDPTTYKNRFIDFVNKKVIPKSIDDMTMTLGYKHYNEMLSGSQRGANIYGQAKARGSNTTQNWQAQQLREMQEAQRMYDANQRRLQQQRQQPQQQQRQHSNPVYRGQMVHNNYNTYNNNNMRAPRHVNRAPQSYIVTVPSGVRPGASFQVNVAGELHVVTCPPSARPGMKVKIFV